MNQELKRQMEQQGSLDYLQSIQIPEEKVSTFAVRFSEEVRVYNKEIHETLQYPSMEVFQNVTLKDLQPMRFGLNGRSMIAQFGQQRQEQFGFSDEDLLFRCSVDQLCKEPLSHVRTIRYTKNKY